MSLSLEFLGRCDCWNTYLRRIYHVRVDIPPRTTFPSVFCSLSFGFELFITIHSSLDCSCSHPRPRAQYMMWALNPIIYIYKIANKLETVHRYWSVSKIYHTAGQTSTASDMVLTLLLKTWSYITYNMIFPFIYIDTCTHVEISKFWFTR